jgi:hypothetical protein
MPRRSKYHEFLATLYELSGAKNPSQFAKLCGKHASQIRIRLNGTHTVTAKSLVSCMEHIHAWNVAPTMEITDFPKWSDIPTSPGVYVLYDSGGNVLYIGKATNLRTEVRQTCGRQIPVGLRIGPKLKKIRPKMGDLAAYLSLYEVSSARVRHNLESLLLRVIANQTHNSNIGRAS